MYHIFPAPAYSFVVTHTLADTMRLISAFKVEEDLQRARIEERDGEIQAEVENNPERARVKPKLEFRG